MSEMEFRFQIQLDGYIFHAYRRLFWKDKRKQQGKREHLWTTETILFKYP